MTSKNNDDVANNGSGNESSVSQADGDSASKTKVKAKVVVIDFSSMSNKILNHGQIQIKLNVKSAKSMSKRSIYEQLTSVYGEGFPADAAQYAIDNLRDDYKQNALEKVKIYQTTISMSTNAIYD